MRIITNKQQKKIDEMFIKKLRFVARATLENYRLGTEMCIEDTKMNQIKIERAMDNAEQVFYADDVI